MRRLPTSRKSGFTLIEVLVALAVAAVAAAAVTTAVANSARTTRLLQQRALAQWIALDRVTEIRLREGLPATGRDTGEVDFADTQWRWEREIKETQVEGLRRIEVSVALLSDPDSDIAFVEGFAGTSAPPGSGRPWHERRPDTDGPDDGDNTDPRAPFRPPGGGG